MSSIETEIHRRVAAADRGENPTVICRMPSGYLVMSDKQNPPGWCILLSVPVVPDLDDLTPEQRSVFLNDMATAGQAIKRVTGAVRMNYSMLGNVEPALHAHLQPRFASDPEEQRKQPVWTILDKIKAVEFNTERDATLMAEIRAAIKGDS